MLNFKFHNFVSDAADAIEHFTTQSQHVIKGYLKSHKLSSL